MATKSITFKQWLSAVRKHATSDGFNDYDGKPPADVCRSLNISKQRLSQLVAADRLDVLEITTAKGTVAMRLVTASSLARYAPNPTGVRLDHSNAR